MANKKTDVKVDNEVVERFKRRTLSLKKSQKNPNTMMPSSRLDTSTKSTITMFKLFLISTSISKSMNLSFSSVLLAVVNLLHYV